ncbi:MAG: CPBP family intramembrane metalloprotease [Defluviitaleaceae bacterium]|nr:CPBP family intramembrane metalloprotease [Defluviitaleaceae bacterium]
MDGKNQLLHKENVAKYTKKDIVVVLCVFLFVLVAYFIVPTFDVGFDIPQDGRPIVAKGIWIVAFAVIFTVILRKDKSLASIGIHSKNLFRSLRLGFAFAFIPVGSMLVLGIVNGWEFNTPQNMLFALLPVAFFAASEDILFVGFFQTRLSGFFINKNVAIFIGGALFVILHYPTRIIGGYFFDVSTIFQTFGWFFMHLTFYSLFKRYSSVFATIVVHTLLNWSTRIWIIPAESEWVIPIWMAVSVAMLFSVKYLWEWRLNKSKA